MKVPFPKSSCEEFSLKEATNESQNRHPSTTPHPTQVEATSFVLCFGARSSSPEDVAAADPTEELRDTSEPDRWALCWVTSPKGRRAPGVVISKVSAFSTFLPSWTESAQRSK